METRTDSPLGGEAESSPYAGPDGRARTEKFVSFKLGGGTYAVLAAAVAEVAHPLPLTPLPDTPTGMLGISPLRGEILAAVDLRRLLGEAPARAADPKAKQIVLKRSSGDAVAIAFTVDRLGEIAALDLSEIRIASSSSEYLIGEAGGGERTVKIVDHSKLAAAIVPA